MKDNKVIETSYVTCDSGCSHLSSEVSCECDCHYYFTTTAKREERERTINKAHTELEKKARKNVYGVEINDIMETLQALNNTSHE